MTLKNYWGFVKKHMDLRGLGIVTLGLALPTMGAMLSTYIPSAVKNAYVTYVPYHDHPAMKSALMVGGTAAVAYTMSWAGLITMQEALAANMVALGLVAVSAAQTLYTGYGSGMLSMLPTAGALDGYGGYYGYLGSADVPELYGGHETYNMGSDPAELFGVKTNVF